MAIETMREFLHDITEKRSNVEPDADALRKAGFKVGRVFSDEIEVVGKGDSKATVMPLRDGVKLTIEIKEKNAEAAAKRLRSLGF